MSAILRLRRQGVGIELRRGTFDIEIDGEQAGSIDWDQSTEIPIEPGHHGLQMRAGRYSSRVHPFEVIEGGVANFRCHGAMMWPRYVASIFQPNLAISLIHE